MPVVFLDRLPLPSLQAYSAISVILLSCSVYYAVQVTSQPGWKTNSTGLVDDDRVANNNSIDNATIIGLSSNESNLANSSILLLDEEEETSKIMEIVCFMIQEPLCIWTLINMAYCCLILIGKFIQKLVFGELRVSEQQHIKDKFWNFVFYKFIFIFGVLNVQFIDEVVLWCSWFSVLGFLHLLAQLSKDRFEYLSFSPTTPKWTHLRLLTLLFAILTMSVCLLVICVVVGLHAGLNTFAFMGAECVLLTLRTLYVMVRYAIHLWDTNREGVWENRGTYIYYTDLVFELTALATDFFHHLHMLLWGNIFLSMASLVICMQLRYLFYEMQRRVKKHKNYLKVVRRMEKNYPMALQEELETNGDDCAICWDKMEAARKLPCGHLFHNSCLRSWLEQDTSCPTCRTSLSDNNDSDNMTTVHNEDDLLGGIGTSLTTPDATPDPQQNRSTTNHFFHFDGSRYVSWLPSFSVEVTHTPLLGERQQAIQTSQLDSMSHQVQQMFPHMPLSLIMDDLRVTRSVEITIENILEERLTAPPFQLQGNRGSPPATTSSISSSSLNSSQETFPSNDNLSDDSSSHHNADFESSLAPGDDEVTRLFPEDFDENDNGKKEDPGKSVVEEPQFSMGGRFSKSSREREMMLAKRKEELLLIARKRYIAKHKEDLSRKSNFANAEEDLEDSAAVGASSSAERRRHRAYEAAQRRLAQRLNSS